MSRREKLRLATRCEHAARVSWRAASDPEHSWDRKANLRMAQQMAEVARMFREEAA